jgi:histidinol-phosphate aminotransferase
MSLQPRRAVERMAPYSPPSGGRAGRLRLDFNENTVGASPRVTALLREKIGASELTIYPEYTAALPVLAAHFGVAEGEMAMTNGTDEAIQCLINTFVDAEDEVIVLHPSYAMYRFYAELAGAVVKSIHYRGEALEFPREEILAAITPRTKAILLSNPNNPTGRAFSMDDAIAILRSAPQAAVLVDEAYFEFHGVTALPLRAEYANLFVSRTFSKTYGLAALRVGCLFSQAANMQHVNKAHSPYSVNWLAAIAAAEAVQDQEYLAAYASNAIAARGKIERGLAQLSIRYWPSAANFVLFHVGERHAEVVAALRAEGVLIRSRHYELPGAVRVTAGTPEQAERFLTLLRQVW